MTSPLFWCYDLSNPRLHWSVLFRVQETPYHNKTPLKEAKHHLHLFAKRLVFSPSPFHHLFKKRQDDLYDSILTQQIYALTSILLEGALVQISLSHWTPPCPGVASEPPQTADDWAVTHSRPHFSLCDCPQSSELCPKTEKHTLLTSRKMQYIFFKNSTARLWNISMSYPVWNSKQ